MWNTGGLRFWSQHELAYREMATGRVQSLNGQKGGQRDGVHASLLGDCA
jgi:hypothetical protein